MKDLLTGEQMLFIELQNSAAFYSYRILKLRKLVGFLIKKDVKMEFWILQAFLCALWKNVRDIAQLQGH